MIRKFVMLKQGADLHTSTFNQCVTYEVARNGYFDEYVKTIRAIYKEQRDAMFEMMDEIFPKDVSWTHPQGDMFLWGVLPEWMDAAELLKSG